MNPDVIYAEIILPLALRQTYTYRIPESLKPSVDPGKRVIVQFGKRKMYTGIVHSLHRNDPDLEEIKEVNSVLDDQPVITRVQLKFWEWMSDYYMCTLGEVFKAALPQGLKLESESKIFASDHFNDFDSLDAGEKALYEFLQNENGLSIKQLISGTGQIQIHKRLQDLLHKKAVYIEERLKEKYVPIRKAFLSLSNEAIELFKKNTYKEHLSRSPRQRELLEHFFHEGKDEELPMELILELFSPGVIKSLVEKGFLIRKEKEMLRSQNTETRLRDAFQLNMQQQEAFTRIEDEFKEKNVVLLHGVTSSGKTEIYIDLIRKTLSEGRQVLYLLPEIALTAQIVERLRKVFGDKTGVFHSKYNDSDRVDVYRRQREEGTEGEYALILGVRSAVFLPFRDLGLIIVDEEHENTFKQYDPAPRYHARDAAIVLAGFYNAKVLLGTATPSVESYVNAKRGKYGYAELRQRYGGVLLPEIHVADLRKARLKKQMRSVFTPALLKQMGNTLENKKQIILFQNRRGYSSYLECELCGYIPRCRSCDVSLTYHKFEQRLVCHYCGFSEKIPGNCNSCNSTRITRRGFGTELVEDELALLFPGVKVARLDLDTTRSRKSYEKILHSFAAGETDILVGTQMLSKGLDFDRVALVGILNADQMLNYPDFRAFERSFQLMSQVSGRAGRKKDRGTVIIQASDPSHPIIKYVIDNNFKAFVRDQIEERQVFKYPPFVKMVRIVIKSRDFQEGEKAAVLLGEYLKKSFGNRVLGPQVPVVGRIKNQYLQHILLKIEREASFNKARQILRKKLDYTSQLENFKRVRVNVDVDPY
ncbi:MAG: replication restart helicase PriA [Bacteroidota bacterium]